MQLQSDIPTGISEEFDILILKYAYKNKDLGLVRWPMPIIPALWEAEVGGSPEVRSSRPAWPTWQNTISTKNTKIAGRGGSRL